MNKYRPVVLLILDGWGLSPSWGGNALAMNNPKTISHLWKTYPHKVLQALGAISDNQIVGESRLGHSLIGTGRIVQSNFSRINQAISDKTFYKNSALIGAINWAKDNNSTLHLIGLVSEGGVHSHLNHLLALLDLTKKEKFSNVAVDLITDGTDSGATDALLFIEKIQKKFNELGYGIFSSIGGRNYALDRDKNWVKTIAYYKSLIGEGGVTYRSAKSAISQNYQKGFNDEFIEPGLILNNGRTQPIKNGDSVIFFNFREDRARQLTRIFSDKKFKTFLFRPKKFDDLYFSTFINYEKDLVTKVAFENIIYHNGISEILAHHDFHQLKVAESQKYAHVSYFFNGGQEEAFPLEDRKIIASPDVESYDQAPKMSAIKITNAILQAMSAKHYDLIVANYANVDMVAHTGNILAVGQAVQCVDEQVKKIVEHALKINAAVIITADHGNAEQMVNFNHKISKDRQTIHTLNPVPFILVAGGLEKNLLLSAATNDLNALSKIIDAKHTLADVAPTILELMSLPKPQQMTGKSLLNFLE